LPVFDVPNWVIRLIVVLIIIGLPVWDPLRGDPRFEQIVASLAPKQ
jgi:hypothetical protein